MIVTTTRNFTSASGTLFQIKLNHITDDDTGEQSYESQIVWLSGPTNSINVEAIWLAFKSTLTGALRTQFDGLDTAIQYYSGAAPASTADQVTRTKGGGIRTNLGNDTLNGYAVANQDHIDDNHGDHNRNELHLYAGRGDDTLNLYFNNINQSYAWGHHVQGEPDDMSSTANVLGADTFNFRGTSAISAGRVVVGRIEDFDYTRDTITLEGTTELDLRNLPSYAEVVYHNGSLNGNIRDGFDPQAWLVVRTGGGTGGYIVYALEADRANPEALSRSSEPHFITQASANEIIALFKQAGRATFVDPQNFVPDGYVAQGAGEYINDYDTNIASANELITGTAAGDLIAAGVNNDTVFADLGNDRIWGGSGHDVLRGEEGNDSLSGNSGNDVFNGGTGTDTAVFKSGVTASVNLLITTAQLTGEGRDTFVSIENVATSFGHDTVTGNDGVNLIQTGSGNDLVYAKNGADRVETGSGSDDLYGDDGDDDLFGGDGADALMGGNGLDSLVGGTGNDTLLGQAGADTLDGDAGDDVFRFQSETDGPDFIVDFSGVTGNNDRLSINATNFGGGLTGGNITAAQFQILTATDRLVDSSDRFIYDKVDNKLYFDANGSAAGQRYHIATFSGAVTLANTDFWLMS